MESGDRAGFLTRLRQRLEQPPHEGLRPILPWDGTVAPIEYRADLSDSVAHFTAALEAVSGRARRVAGEADLRDLVHGLCREHGVRRVVLSRDPECAAVVPLLAEIGVEAQTLRSPEQAAGADLGVTGAAFGIALTGSIVVEAERAGGRTASLLPPVHLALLRADRIVSTPGYVLRAIPRRPTGVPSNLVFITGPSRSADIELQLTLGVHGPRHLVVGLMTPSESSQVPGPRSQVKDPT